MVQLRKRGKWALTQQNENSQIHVSLSEVKTNSENYKFEKTQILDSKQEKIDEIIELAARTENSIESEAETLSQCMGETN